MIKKIINFPYYFILLTIFPIVSLYVHNIEQVTFSSTLRSYLVLLAVALIIYAFLFIILRKLQHTALVISFGLFLFYLVIPFQAFLIDSGIQNLSRIRFLFPAFFLAFVAGAYQLIKIKNSENITKLFNTVAFSTMIIPLYQIVVFFVSAGFFQNQQAISLEPSLPHSTNIQSYPDVYYILLDTHGRSDDIRNDLGYDNSPILAKLSELGFYIAPCSTANYPSATWQSMYVTLNMDFFENKKVKFQNPEFTLNETNIAFKHNAVLENFKSYGYYSVGFNTLYDFLNFTDADIYYDLAYYPNSNIKLPNKFESMLLLGLPGGQLVSTSEKNHYDNVLKVLKKLPQIPQEVPSPKFIYAHILVPHYPYVFSSTGEYVADSPQEFTPKKFVDQVAFIDEQIALIAQNIIKNSATPPIIIIQGDHGLGKSGILNAYYLPGENTAEYLYPTISPVNSFRVVFNHYFDANMSLLPDNIYHDNLGSDLEHKNTGVPYIFSQDFSTEKCTNEK